MNPCPFVPPSRFSAALVLSLLPVFAADPAASGEEGALSVEILRRDAKPASRLLGATVKTPRGEKVGRVEDLYVDLKSGQVRAVLISSGGFLGVGDALSAIPPAEFSPGDNGDLRLDTTRELLGAAPRIGRSEAAAWSGSGDPAPVLADAGVTSSESDPPVGSAGPRAAREHRHDADNTGRNRRDRESTRSVGPFDQGNSRPDLSLTSRIRSEILGQDGFSTNAKNIKIVTRDGEVTLRGPVASSSEKQRLAEIAERHAPGRVTNQLEPTQR